MTTDKDNQTVSDTDITRAESPKAKPTKPAKGLTRANPFDLLIVGLDNVPGLTEDNPLYKRLVDERKDIKLTGEKMAMLKSLKGNVPPVEVWPWRYDGKLYTLVFDGRQRVRYLREEWAQQDSAGAPEDQRITVPYYFTSVDESKLFSASRSRNVTVRSDPFSTARDMKKLMGPEAEGGENLTTVQVGEVYGLTDERVRQYLALLTLTAAEQVLIADLGIPQSAATILANIDGDEERMAAILDLKAAKDQGIKPTREEVKKKANKATGKTGNSPTDKLDRVVKSVDVLAKADDKGSLKRTESATKEELLATIATLLTEVDSIARAVYPDHPFPKPIKDQQVGYTLAVVSNTGD